MKPVSLFPLTPDDAIQAAFGCPELPPGLKKPKKAKSKKKAKRKRK